MNPDDPRDDTDSEASAEEAPDASASSDAAAAEDTRSTEDSEAPAPAAAEPLVNRPSVSEVPAPPPSPRRLATFQLLLLSFCLVVGVVSLVTGPHTPEADVDKDEYEIFGPADMLTAGLRPDGVAVVRIDGGIMFEEPAFGGAKNADRAVDLLRKIAKASSVKAVVLRVNSPGGTVAASQEIAEAVRRVRAAGKKVVVSMADMAASGGYYVSAPSDYIFAHRGTITGSIGVITQLPRYREIADKVGYDVVSFTSGPFKDMGNPFREMGDEEGGLFKKLVMESYLQFVEEVARGRAEPILAAAEQPKNSEAWSEQLEKIRAGEDDRPRHPPEAEKKKTGPQEGGDGGDASGEEGASGDPEPTGDEGSETSPEETPEEEELDMAAVRRRVAELADGRIYSGEEALRLGLVDAIGGLRDAIRKAGELSGLGPDPVILRPQGRGDLGKIFQLMGQGPTEWMDGLASRVGASLGVPAAPVLPATVPVAYLYLPGK